MGGVGGGEGKGGNGGYLSFLNRFMRIDFHLRLRGASFPHGASMGNRSFKSISTLSVINCWE